MDQQRHQRKVHQQDLYEQGRAAKKGHVGAGRHAHQIAHQITAQPVRRIRQPRHTHEQADQGAEHHRHQRNDDRHLHAFHEQWCVVGDHSPAKIHIASPCKKTGPAQGGPGSSCS
ncbi:hypothetical protein D3C86_1748600 [compost metagenome]